MGWDGGAKTWDREDGGFAVGREFGEVGEGGAGVLKPPNQILNFEF